MCGYIDDDHYIDHGYYIIMIGSIFKASMSSKTAMTARGREYRRNNGWHQKGTHAPP
jgi:hypothetical protein